MKQVSPLTGQQHFPIVRKACAGPTKTLFACIDNFSADGTETIPSALNRCEREFGAYNQCLDGEKTAQNPHGENDQRTFRRFWASSWSAWNFSPSLKIEDSRKKMLHNNDERKVNEGWVLTHRVSKWKWVSVCVEEKRVVVVVVVVNNEEWVVTHTHVQNDEILYYLCKTHMIHTHCFPSPLTHTKRMVRQQVTWHNHILKKFEKSLFFFVLSTTCACGFFRSEGKLEIKGICFFFHICAPGMWPCVFT